ncbi:carboxypeptidase regulatory-like domain-containing protein [Agromyces sp. NPDC057865]|uniref:carboxypeptidase regulatory-like domain-containing protein n=1 Tax=Agromyces sp. NPDC057865 TaxID=3346267 RepID=UPI00366CF38F
MTRPPVPLVDRTTLHRRTRTLVVSVLAVVLMTQTLSAAPAWAAPRTVSGTVSFGITGTHPEAVTAKVTWELQTGATWTPGPVEGVPTDAQGRYSIDLEPGLYRLKFTPSSGDYQAMYWKATTVRDQASTLYVTQEPVATYPVTGIDTTLPRTGSISGRVFLGSGARLAAEGQVKVTAAFCSEGGCSTRGESSTLTDAQGSYAFTGLVNGTYTVSFAYVPGVEFLPPSPVVVTVSNWQQQFAARDVTMAPTGSISGVVRLGPAGTLAGADEVIVTAMKWGAENGVSTRTGADGRYQLSGLPLGVYDLFFDYAGSAGFADQVWPQHPARASNLTNFSVMESPLTRDITLPKATSLSGTVRNATGAPIAGVTVLANVSVYDSTGNHTTSTLGTVVTGADGAYAFPDLPPASYDVQASVGQGYVQTSIRQSLGAGEVRSGADVTMYRFTRLFGWIQCDGCDDYAITSRLGVRLERNVGTRSEPVWVDAAYRDTYGNSYDFRNSDVNLVPGIYRAKVVGNTGLRMRANVSPAITIEDGANVELDLVADILKFDRDFSGDEKPDVLVRTSTGAMLMYTGDGASGWKGASTIGSGWTAMNHVFAAGDFSGDGHEDVMARDNAGRLHLYRGDGNGGWLGWSVVGTGWGHMTAIFSPGDFSGDGNADVMARDGAGDLWLYPGDGKGGWGAVSKVGSGWNMFDTVFAAGDFGYGEANVMARTPSGDLWLYPASGGGGWSTPSRVGTGWNIFDAVFGSGDFDGDGLDDVMGRDRSGRLWLYPAKRSGSVWGTPSIVGTGWGHLAFVS